jgi:hypothetical protein
MLKIGLFVLGLITGLFLNHFMSPVRVERLEKATLEASKEDVIKEIITFSEVGNIVFTDLYFPVFKSSLLKTNTPNVDLLKDEKFWDNLKTKEFEKISKINGDFKNLSVNFYTQFTKEELLIYLNSIKNPVLIKVQQSFDLKIDKLNAFYEKAYSNMKDELLDELQDEAE